MEIQLTLSNIMLFAGIVGTIFTVYNIFRKPQEEIETKQAVSEEKDKNKATVLAQKEAENKASLLDQQVRLTNEANEKKFIDLAVLLKDSMALAQNHIHTVDTKVDNIAVRMSNLEKGLVRLSTIIEERIPRKL
jgi:hypothetical protein